MALTQDSDGSSTSMAPSTTLTARCYCQSVHFTITVASELLPLGLHLCQCPICRYTHGMLSVFHAPLPSGIEPRFIAPSSLASVTGYRHAQAASVRFFCSTCGCHIGDEDIEPDPATGKKSWRVATSIFDTHTEDVFRIQSHAFTRTCPNGGFFTWLPSLGDREVKQWHPDPGDKNFPIPPAPPSEQEFDAHGNERLRAECHCGGVSFTIPRPTAPDTTEDPVLRKWVSPLDPNKWIATLDLCDDCRLMDGTHVIAWTFVPLAQVEPAIKPDLRHGTLVSYASTPGVLRAFCGVCGATVFYTCEDRTPTEKQQVVDVAVGILRAPEGPLAENWLSWRTGRIGAAESGSRCHGTLIGGEW
jgi:hypothetical protein